MLTDEQIKEARRCVVALPLACDDINVARSVGAILTGALDEVDRLRAALAQIAKDPHQAYGEAGGYTATTRDQSQYNMGCADGHRCAAGIARRALGVAGDS